MSDYIGILATGSASGIWYYSKLQELSRLQRGEDFVCPVKLLSIPFEEINMLLPHQMDKAAERMELHFREAEALGVRRYIMANMTLHEAFDKKHGSLCTEHFLHIKEVFNRSLPSQTKKVMVLGTAYTTKNPVWDNWLPEGVRRIIPSEKLVKEADELRKVYYYGTDPGLAETCFDNLQNTHPEVDFFIIACTELALALDAYPGKERFFNLPLKQCALLFEEI